MRHEDADNLLADAIWWFRGFEASNRTFTHPMEVPTDPTRGLGDSLNDVRDWIRKLAEGRDRLLGVTDWNRGCAITEGELEILHDGLRLNADPRDIDLARAKLNEVFEQFRNEAAARPDSEVPF